MVKRSEAMGLNKSKVQGQSRRAAERPQDGHPKLEPNEKPTGNEQDWFGKRMWKDVDFTHHRAVGHSGGRPCVLDSCPAVGHGQATPPDTPRVFVLHGLVPAVLPGHGPLRAGQGIIAPGDVTGVHLFPKVLFNAALPGQCPPPGQ